MASSAGKIIIFSKRNIVIDTLLHTIGICGEPHVKVVDIIPFYSYIVESNIGLYVNDSWQKLKN